MRGNIFVMKNMGYTSVQDLILLKMKTLNKKKFHKKKIVFSTQVRALFFIPLLTEKHSGWIHNVERSGTKLHVDFIPSST